MHKKSCSMILTLLILMNTLILAFDARQISAEPKTWIVDDDGPGDFHSIEEAVISASNGDTILVREGYYSEIGINVNKSLKIIADGSVIIDGQGVDTEIFDINSNDVTISGFTLINTNWWCIDLYRCSRVLVKNNIIKNCKYGIILSYSKNNVIEQNFIQVMRDGIDLSDSDSNNIIKNNKIEYGDNGIEGSWSCDASIISNNEFKAKGKDPGSAISLDLGDNNIIERNSCDSGTGFHITGNGNVICDNILLNSSYGFSITGNNNTISNNIIEKGDIRLISSSNCSIYRNFIMESFEGIYLHECRDIIVKENIINGSFWTGIYLIQTTNSILDKNVINNTMVSGIWIDNSYRNIVTENFVGNSYGGEYWLGIGISIYDSRDNIIYHNNFINNKFKNADINNIKITSINTWDDGYPSGGNYWSDYTGVDANGDGIGDTPYIIDQNNVDHYPLMKPYEIPVAPPVQRYILHAQSYPITGIQISYSGDYSGTGMTNFDIGPENSPFTVTLTAPLTHRDYTFDHWQLDGINAGKDLTITIKLDDQNKERTVVAFYSQNINDFSISVAQQRYVVLPGESITCYLNITSINDFDSTVSLALTISPYTDDIKLSLESTNIKPPKNGFTIVALYVSALPNAKVGNYKISVVGTSRSLSRSDDFILEISTLSNLVKIGEILTTLYNVSYQEENTYISVPIFNFGSNPKTITLSASTNSKDWSIAPSTLKVQLRPSTYLKNKGFLVGYNLVFFNLKFGSKADFKGNFTITIDETSEKKVLEMKVYSAISKSILMGVEKSAAYVFLPLSYGHLGGLGIPNDKKVKDFALSVLKNEGIDENANEEVKLKAIFKYVLNHMEFGIRVPPPTIYTIVDEIEKNGGVSGKHKITGDCKVYSFFFGGLAKALGFDVRLVCGIMEASTDVLHMVGHTWVEVKVNKKWIFVDPTSGLFNRTYSDQQTLPDNLDLDAFDAKKAYELDPQWGGPLTATGYRGGLAFDDLIGEYKFSIPPTPEGLVLTAHSPIMIYLYDKNWNLINISLPYRIFWVGLNYTMGSYEDGLWIYSPKMLDEYYVKLVGTGSGSFSLCALYMNASSSKFATFNGTIKEGEELLLKIEVDSEGEPTFALVKKEDGLMKVLSIITIIVIIACIPTYIFIRKNIRKKKNKSSI